MEEVNMVRLYHVSEIPRSLMNSQCSASFVPIKRVIYRQPLLGEELFVFVISDNGSYLQTESSSCSVNKATPYYSFLQTSKRPLSPYLDTSYPTIIQSERTSRPTTHT